MTFIPNRNFLNRRHLLKLGASSAASALFALGGCRQQEESQSDGSEMIVDEEVTTSEAPSNGILRLALSGPPPQVDPAFFGTIEAYLFGFMVYDGLIWIDHELTPQPMLAESWEQADDLLSWIFQLRREVIFQHGTSFSAKDVTYTFGRLLDPETGSSFRSVLSFVAGVEAIDDYTVRFDLHTPNVDFPLLMGAAQARIVAHDYDAELLAIKASGTGPFQVEEFFPDRHAIFVRNANYRESDTLYLQEVHHIYLSSPEKQVEALTAGEVDLIPDIGIAHLELLADNPDVQLLEIPSGAYQTIVMQVTEEPFNDMRVRQALKYCVDRPTIQDSVLQGHGEVGNDHPVASISPFWLDLPMRSPDIGRARQLLTEAGYPEGIELTLITSTVRPGMDELAVAFREMAAAAGITINIIHVPPDTYWSDYWGKAPFHIGNWNFRPSIDETLMLAYHSTSTANESRWSSPELDEWIDTARSEPDPDTRKALYEKAQQLIMEEGGVTIPYFRSVLTAVQKHVRGFAPHPAGWLDLRGVQIAE